MGRRMPCHGCLSVNGNAIALWPVLAWLLLILTLTTAFPLHAAVPGAPTITSAFPEKNGKATILFTAPEFDGGSAITGYTVTSSPDNLTANGSASPITIAGLTIGTSYTFTVTATNSDGTGPASGSITVKSRLYAPTSGTINNLAVFIRFSDQPEFSYSLSYYDGLFNTAGNSLKNFYLESSYNTLTVNTTLYPASNGPGVISYQDAHPTAYYQPYNAATNPIGYQGAESTARETALITNALNAISAQIPAGLELDGNNDGYIDHISFEVYSTSANPPPVLFFSRATYDTSGGVTLNGKKVGTYTWATSSQDFLSVPLASTEIHEMGHSFGFPDLRGKAGRTPVGNYDVMSISTAATHSGAYEKFRFTDWIPSIPVISAYGQYTLNDLTQSTNNAYKIALPNSSEFLILEYRKASGQFESHLPDSGLCITRVNEAAGMWGNLQGPPFFLYYFRVDGTLASDGVSANFTCLSAETGRTQLNDQSNPYCFLSNGNPCGISIYNVGSAAGSSISFSLGDPSTATVNRVISGYLANGGNRVIGATVTLSGDADGVMTTLNLGKYLFVVNDGGNYTVTPTIANLSFNPANKVFANITSDQVQNFTASNNTTTISGTVSSGGVPLSGAVVTCTGGNNPAPITTDATGSYSFTVNTGAAYVVRASKANYFVTPVSRTLSNVTTSQFGQDFSTYTGTVDLTGNISYNGSPLAGVSVSVPGADTASPITTDGSGNYAFTVTVGNGSTYTVTPSSAAYIFSPASRFYTGLVNNQTGNFTASALPSSTSALASSQNPSVSGQAVTFTATVTGSAPTGSVTFNDGGTAVCSAVPLANGQAQCLAYPTGAGNHNMVAVYSGDANNASSSSPTLTQAVTDSQVIHFGSAPALKAGANAMVIASATSGLSISFGSATPLVCTLAGTTVSALADGPCIITADQAGNMFYGAAPQATQTIVVGTQAASIVINAHQPNPSAIAEAVNVSLLAGPANGVMSSAAGGSHHCALTVSGGVNCWGYNATGQLGDGSTTDRLAPVAVSGLSAGVSALAAGQNHTCALVAGGVQCWGGNHAGQIGADAVAVPYSAVPIPVPGLTSGVLALAAGADYNCALTNTPSVKCWGDNSGGQLGDGLGGDGDSPPTPTPVSVDFSGVNPSGGITAIGTAYFHACAIDGSGAVFCWGWNNSGQLGDGTQTVQPKPVAMLAPQGMSGVTKVVGGLEHSCALTGAGAVWCWGGNSENELGGGNLSFSKTPIAVPGLAGVVSLAAGLRHNCAVDGGGAVSCWGSNWFGEIGSAPELASSAPPQAVAGLASSMSGIALGDSHSCAVTLGGSMQCFGRNATGQLGDGGSTDRSAPGNVIGYAVPTGTISVSGGVQPSCNAVLANGSANCSLAFASDGQKTLNASYAGDQAYGSANAAGVAHGVTPPAILLGPASLPAGTFGASYNQSVSASGGTAPYGYTVTAGSLPGGLGLAATGGLSGTATAGGSFNFTVTATDANGSTGTQAYGISIAAIGQTITFAPATPVTYGNGASFALTASASSGLNSFTFSTSSAASICTVTGNTVSITGSGTCALIASQAGNANYTSALANANVLINKANQTISFANPGTQTFGTTPTLSASASATSGLAPVFTSATNAVCTISAGGQLNFVATGTCTINADQPGNNGYAAAMQVVRSFSVNPVPPQCTLNAAPATITAGGFSILTASCVPAATSYAWANAVFGTSVSGGSVAPAVTTAYAVIGSNAGGAGNNAGVTVTVNPLTPPVCTLTASPASIVAGASSTLTASCTPAAASYQWTNTGFAASAAGGSVSPATTTTYSVTGTNAAGTGAAASTTVKIKKALKPSQINVIIHLLLN